MAGGPCKRVVVGGHCVVVLADVSEDEGVGIQVATLHLLSRCALLEAATPVVSPVQETEQPVRSVCSDAATGRPPQEQTEEEFS